MRTISNRILSHGGSALAVAVALMYAGSAVAQTATPDETPAEAAGAGESGNENEIVVTGSRIERAGFDQPTPTTVVGNTEIRQAAQPNLQQVLNEQPQMRNTTSQETSAANTSSGVAPVDMRGLGSSRTLTLVNGRRFIGDNNLNFVPSNMVERIELVTGGASAAWGSGAVAGVVNIILNDKLEGLTLGANTGISSRGDGFRYGFDGSFGTSFAGGRGHFMIGAEYVRDKRIGPEGMKDRPWYGGGFVAVPGGRELQPNIPNYGATSFGGAITNGILAGQVFNPDGSLRASTADDAINVYQTLNVKSPLERLASYARLSYDVGGGATVWADFAYGRTHVNQPFLPDTSIPLSATIQATNPFLSQSIRDQLDDAGETSFKLARLYRDTAFLQFDATRETFEGAVGIEGSLGSGWKYDAHFSHGETDSRQRMYNSAITGGAAGGLFARAINAVQTPGGIVCGVNADADQTNNDSACVPYNPFGEGAASQAARDYVTGTQMSDGTSKLDSAAVRIQGDPFSLWAGPVSIAIGAEARWEEQSSVNGDLDKLRVLDALGNPTSIFGNALYANPVSGSTSVKEAFGEIILPLLDVDQAKVELNGAARYSDYSRSGGIWSWKIGGTARLFDSLLLRATRSRDIRAPGIGELFSTDSLNIRKVVDNDSAGRAGTPGYNATPTITLLTSGNPNLVPEVSKTWTVGGSISPSFLQGFNLSVDYYDIKIGGAISTLDTADITRDCAAGDADACARVDRDSTGTITRVRAQQANIASFQTNGVDVEASYLLPLSRISTLPGSLRFRALATWVDKVLFETPGCIANNNCRQPAGSVGDTVVNGTPHWRGTFSTTYQTDDIGLDLRVRYVGGGKIDAAQTDIVNNDISARIYVDLGAQFKVMDKFTLFGNVRNVFDRNPPVAQQLGGTFYDSIGRYFTAGVRLNF